MNIVNIQNILLIITQLLFITSKNSSKKQLYIAKFLGIVVIF